MCNKKDTENNSVTKGRIMFVYSIVNNYISDGDKTEDVWKKRKNSNTSL